MHAEQAYLFRHAVMRDVAYQLIVPSERVDLHGLALAAWEADSRPAAQYAAELADHARHAGDTARELGYLRVAAPLARSEWHNAAAADLYARLAQHPASTVDERVNGWLKCCDSLDAAGDSQRALAATRQAVEFARGSPALLAVARYGLAHQLVAHARFPEALETATEALDAAREAGDRRTEAKALVSQARALHRLGRGDESEKLARLATQVAALADDPQFEASMQCSAAFVLFARGATAEGAAMLEANVEAVAGGNADTYAQVLAGIGTTRLQLGDPDGALRYLNRALEFSREIGHLRTQTLCHSNLGVYYYERGEYDLAEPHYLQALAGHRELGNRASEALVLGNLTGFYSTRSNMPRSIKCGREALKIAQATGDMPQQLTMLGYLSRALWQTGRLAASEAALRDGLRRGSASAANTEISSLRAFLANVLLQTGRVTEAVVELDRAEESQPRQADPGHWVRFVLPTEFRLRLWRADVPGARELLAEAGSGFGEFTRELEADAAEHEAATAQGRTPMLWGGTSIDAMKPPLRRALAACLPTTEPGRAAIAAKPGAFALLTRGLEDVPPPDWANPDWLQETGPFGMTPAQSAC